MREIKFRLWDNNRLKMYYNRVSHDTERCNGVLMQFTGLQDKHGVDIYEGDILSYRAFNGTEWTDQEIAVYFDSGAFKPVFDMMPEYFEVVGNIYERREQ